MESYCTLISETFTTDALLQQVATETTIDVPCTVASVTRSEWVSAGQNSINAELVIRTPIINYSGQRIVSFAGKRYAVYRTFMNEEEDVMELYLQLEGGRL